LEFMEGDSMKPKVFCLNCGTAMDYTRMIMPKDVMPKQREHDVLWTQEVHSYICPKCFARVEFSDSGIFLRIKGEQIKKGVRRT